MMNSRQRPVKRGFAMLALVAAVSVAETPVDYDTQIKPILEANCYHCHGPEMQESALRLDLRPSLLQGGDTGAPAIVPHKPDDGEILGRLTSDDAEFRMPRAADPLPAEQIALIRTWIEQGADWPGQMDAVLEKKETTLWSMQPLSEFAPPATGKNPIDAMLNAKLEPHGLTVNGEANPMTLARRASIILTGLPPTPERVDSFLNDWAADSTMAYNALLDELFASPHYGERWAQHWLDVIRWAETTGYESNEFRKNAWPYRDYVVDAFNTDKPYDQFVREQIAGDSLQKDVATGFLVAGPHAPAATVGQQPTDILQARFDRLDETIQSVGAATMAITFNCARCHNHKFDPISIKDYYSMAAIFNDVEYDHRAPVLPEDDPKVKTAGRLLSDISKEREGFAPEESWLETWADHIKVQFPPTEITGLRFHFKAGRVTIDEIELFASRDDSDNLTQREGLVVTSSKKVESISRPAQLVVDNRFEKHFGWMHRAKDSGDSHPWLQIALPEPMLIGRADLGTDRLAHYAWQYMVTGSGKPVTTDVPDSLEKVEIQSVNGEWTTVYDQVNQKPSGPQLARARRIKELAQRYDKGKQQPLFIGRLLEDVKPMHVMHRGSPTSPKQEVAPMAPEVLNGDMNLSSATPGPERRLAFANWLTQPENPLTARVYVNRLWHHVFGAGIVSTPADFGFAGGKPSHPELLDWMAADFMKQGWSTKSLLRKIVSSDAFKRSSAPSEDWADVDADARLLWRFPPRWQEAEVLRDMLLMSAGSLRLEAMGGEGYHIHKPKPRYAQWEVVNNYGEHTWRRMLYQQRMRRVDDQMFTAFDFPDCAQVKSKRTRSTTPLQAFNLLNGKLVVEQAARLAERVKSEVGEQTIDQVSRMFWLTLGRPPEAEELSITSELAKQNGLPAVARTLFNLNEFFYLN